MTTFDPFYLFYQPKLREGQIVGLEALLRATGPNLTPLNFVASCKDSVILDISVLKLAIEQSSSNGLSVPISVNIHPSSVLDERFLLQAKELSGHKNVILELVEYENIEIDETFFQT